VYVSFLLIILKDFSECVVTNADQNEAIPILCCKAEFRCDILWNRKGWL